MNRVSETLKRVPTSAFAVLSVVFVVLPWLYAWHCNKVHRGEMSRLESELAEVSAKRDSLECLQNIESVVIAKAGEFAARPRCYETEFTVEAAAILLTELGAWYPDIKLAQYQCESGFGKSAMAKGANNMGGMRVTGKRPTTQIKGSDWNGYGIYNNWESFIIDHILWDQSVFGCRKPSRAEYVATLDRIYGGHGDYGQTMDKESLKYRWLFDVDAL